MQEDTAKEALVLACNGDEQCTGDLFDSNVVAAAAGQQAHAAIASAMAGGNTKKSKYRGVNANWSRWRAQVGLWGFCARALGMLPCKCPSQ